jgi:hypothetical protein
MNELPLRSVFRNILLASSLTPALVGCGGSETTIGGPLNDASASNDAAGQDGALDDGSQYPDVVLCPGIAIDAIDGGRTLCSTTVTIAPPCASGSGAQLSAAQCQQICGPGTTYPCRLVYVSPDGTTGTVQCGLCVTGRRPAGLARAKRCVDGTPIAGEWLAAAAYLEEASVVAFRTLRAELAAHGAPARLTRAAMRAARDEVRHARTMTALAGRFGAAPAKVVVAARRRRSLEAIALENATEGCVRETFGALVATWQARAAADPEARGAMETIARDETRHAELAWAVARWIEPRLSAAARRRVARARRRAAAALVREAAIPPPETVVTLAGVPRAHDAQQLAARLASALPLR